MPTLKVRIVIVVRKKGRYGLAIPKYISLTARSDEEDETAELYRELEKIKKERAEQRELEVHHLKTVTPMSLTQYFLIGTRKGCRRTGKTRI